MPPKKQSPDGPTADEVANALAALEAPLIGPAAPVIPDPTPRNRQLEAHVRLGLGSASCSTCIFSTLSDTGGLECRRHPPVRGSGERWPAVLVKNFCGEYLPALEKE